MRANYTLTPGGEPIRGEGQLITSAVWHWIVIPALVIAGAVVAFSLVSLGHWSATPATTTPVHTHTNTPVAPPQPQKIEVEVKGLSMAVNKLDNAVDKLDAAVGKISSLAPQPPPMPTTPTPATTSLPTQIEVSGSLAIHQQTPTTTDICAAPKKSLTPKEREWRFWNCPEK